MTSYRLYSSQGHPGAGALLKINCRECTLKAAPAPEANFLWEQPWLRLDRLPRPAPFWVVRGLAYIESQRRVF